MNKNCKMFYPTELIFTLFIISNNIRLIECFSQMKQIDAICKGIELLVYIGLLVSCKRFVLSKNRAQFLLFFCLIFALVFWKTRIFSFFIGALLYFTTEKVRFDKVMELSWKTYFFMIVFSFLLYFLGISDGGITRTYDITRQTRAFGFVHPNIGGRWILMMLLSKIYWDCNRRRNQLEKFGDILFYLVSLWTSLFILKCRTAFLVILIVFCGIFFIMKNELRNRIVCFLFEMLQPFLLLFSLISAMIYPRFGTDLLDRILSHRVFLCKYHLVSIGLSLFGKTVDYSKFTLDNSYISYLLQYGIIPLSIYSVLSVLAIRKAWKQKDRLIIVISVAIFIFGFMENGIFDLTTNYAFIFLLTGNKRFISNES